MKNILIITNTRDNLGSAVSFVKDINDIVDVRAREMVAQAIAKTGDWEDGDMWYNNDMCGSDSGYIFNDYALFDTTLPVTVEHIVNYVF
jgi:hypothetical protein